MIPQLEHSTQRTRIETVLYRASLDTRPVFTYPVLKYAAPENTTTQGNQFGLSTTYEDNNYGEFAPYMPMPDISVITNLAQTSSKDSHDMRGTHDRELELAAHKLQRNDAELRQRQVMADYTKTGAKYE